jgi:hypothetical protein
MFFKLSYKSLRISYGFDVDVVDVDVSSTCVLDPENAFWYKPASGFVIIRLRARGGRFGIDGDQRRHRRKSYWRPGLVQKNDFHWPTTAGLAHVLIFTKPYELLSQTQFRLQKCRSRSMEIALAPRTCAKRRFSLPTRCSYARIIFLQKPFVLLYQTQCRVYKCMSMRSCWHLPLSPSLSLSQVKLASQTCKSNWQVELASRTCKSNLQVKLASQTCKSNLQVQLASPTCKSNLQVKLQVELAIIPLIDIHLSRSTHRHPSIVDIQSSISAHRYPVIDLHARADSRHACA